MEAVATTLIGLIGGFLLSGLLWYITAHLVKPGIEFSESISRIRTRENIPAYRLKLMNVGRRAIIDVEVNVRIEFPRLQLGTVPPIRADRQLKIVDGKRYLRIRGRGGNEVINLKIDHFIEENRDGRVLRELYPVKSQRDSVTLEDLLARSPGVNIRVVVLCFDEWSGARKCFYSSKYGLADIKEGRFVGLKVVSDKPASQS